MNFMKAFYGVKPSNLWIVIEKAWRCIYFQKNCKAFIKQTEVLVDQ